MDWVNKPVEPEEFGYDCFIRECNAKVFCEFYNCFKFTCHTNFKPS